MEVGEKRGDILRGIGLRADSRHWASERRRGRRGGGGTT